MRRTIATLGVVGLGVMAATVTAAAAPPDTISICHATHSQSNPYIAVTISLSALSAHAGDTHDIVPTNAGADMPNGQNLSPGNLAILAAGCAVGASVGPSESPKPSESPSESPSAAKAAAVPAANVGHNVQTAVGGNPDAGIPLWLSALTGLFMSGAAAVLCTGRARARKADS
ncbi:hypothetical protein E5206_09665 [Arthrobacter sp. PAMC25564]|uniref:hypothetical protein n=1 Tax=Arthrobacter sp. PAMC25564 TaxID=2565366 RepID=UPI0010A28B6A|nr:hypothetical protein [Arthrobacter sp. PAMC25564]QCB97168.1 hypothetical protein E5206_09665 [Arthrobacter sp. PAMC25564]